MKKIITEFKEFISRGNVMDMAVGVVVGGAFTGIVNSLVSDVLTPIIAIIMSTFSKTGLEFSQFNVNGIMIGNFINTIISFLFTAAGVFIMVKFMNAFKRKEEPAPETTKECPYCKSVISIDAVKCPHCTSDL